MEWLSNLAAPLMAGIALGIALNAWSSARETAKKVDNELYTRDSSFELPKSVKHVLDYQHLWPSQFERAVRYVAQEEIARASTKPEPKPMPVVIVHPEKKENC